MLWCDLFRGNILASGHCMSLGSGGNVHVGKTVETVALR